MAFALGGRGLRAVFTVLLFGVIAISRPAGTSAQEPPAPPQRWDGLIERLTVSNDWNGEAAFANPRASRHAVSGDGRYFVFSAEVPNPPNPPVTQWFIRDRMNGYTNVLMPTPANAPPVISSDGNHVAFESCEWEYRPEGQVCDVIAVDLRNFAIGNMSTAPDGTLSAGHSREPMLSRDGRFIVFRTDSPTLLPPGAAPGQIVLRDRDADQDGLFDEPDATTIRVVSTPRVYEAGNLESATPIVSADGRFVAFRSKADNLVPDDTNNAWDVFLHDVELRRTVRVNVGWDRQEATPQIDSPAISMSEDGRYVAFAADDAYIVNPPVPYPDLNDALDVFVYDHLFGTVTRVDVGEDGQIGQGGHTYWPSLSADGRYVSVVSTIANAANPGTPGRAHVYVYDRVAQQATRVSVKPDGSEPDRGCAYSTISADGSVVTFVSQATNLPTGAAPDTDTIYAAVYFEIDPLTVTLPARGGTFAASVAAQQYVRWEAFVDDWWWLRTNDWISGVGSGLITFEADRNWNPAPRTNRVHLNSRAIAVTQEAGLHISGFSPAQAPATGGTVVTITGSGFEPGMSVDFAGNTWSPASNVEFVSTTTLRATTPPMDPGLAWINVFTGDGSANAGTSEPFRFTDVTPPAVEGFVRGPQGADGWFTGDVSIDFSYWDPESSITSWNGCEPFTLRTDTAGTTYTCAATSEGGTATASVFVKRDASGPEIELIAPAQTLYRQDANVLANFQCTDALNQTAECTGQLPLGAPIDLSPGYHAFTVMAMDSLANPSWRDVMYAVASGVCAPRPEGLVAWFPFETIDGPTPEPSIKDAFSGSEGEATNIQFVPGAAGSFAIAPSASPSYVANPSNDLYRITGPMTLSAWVRPGAGTGTTQVIAGREGEYMLALDPDARVLWAMATAGRAWVWNSSSFQLQRGEWAHVALTFDGAHVRVFVNGLNYEAWWGSGPVGDARPDLNEFRIGASEDPAVPAYFSGAIDEVMLLNRALSVDEIRNLFFAGEDSLCGKRMATVTVTPNPAAVQYGKTVNQIFTVTVQNETGAPVAGRHVLFFDPSGQLLVTGDTDASGQLRIGAPLTGTAIGTQPGFEARFSGDFYYSAATGSNLVTVERAVPTLTWPTPAFGIVYGTPLGATQLNATASVPGTFTYTPPSGTVLAAGTHRLSVDFVPADATLYENATASVLMYIFKATPTVTVTGGTFRYDGLPHAATGTVTGVGGVTLGPLTFTYNGSPDPPVEFGTYTVVATYAGDANHTSASATTTLRIGDGTSPVIVPLVEGTLGANGWYTSDVRVSFSYSDPESSITGTSGCTTFTHWWDTAGTTYTCTATSAGGTGSASVTIKRDTTPPVATIMSPLPTVYTSGAIVVPAFTCSDPLSGAATCVGSTTEPVDTITPGYHAFLVTASDQAGNSGTTTLEYAVGTNACVYPLANLRGWWRFEGERANWMFANNDSIRNGLTSDTYVPSVVGQGYLFEGTNGFLDGNFAPRWWNDEKFAIAAWVKPSANTLGAIVRAREGYAVARLANGNIGWAFRKFNVPGLTYYDTGIKLPLDVWSHVVVDLADTVVKTYLNGRLVHTATNIGDVYNFQLSYAITIGGAEERPEYFKGAIDEVQVFDHGIDAPLVEQLFLAGGAGACVHKRASIEIADPVLAYFGSTTYAIDARLVDSDGLPIVGRTVTIVSQIGVPYLTYTHEVVTDADGRVHWDAPLRNAPRGVYEDFMYLRFPGDLDYTGVRVSPDILVGKGTPVITWPEPAPITYGMNLSNTQLNATADVAGTFAYSPALYTSLPAGSHTLSTTFTPSDSSNYDTATATVPLTVNKATPTVTVTGGTFVYDGAPHAATGTVKALGNVNLGTPTFTYNGSAEPPIAAGSYEVIASYAGSANYEGASATTTVTITTATASLTWPNPASIDYGTPLGGAQLNASSDVPGTFTYSPAAGTILPAGVQTIFVTFTPADAVNYQESTASVTLTVNKAVPAVTWPTPADITYGTALSEAQLNATADVAGTFAYSQAAGALLNAGVHSLYVTFTPDDAANYLVTGTGIVLRVNPALPAVSWPAPAAVVYGTALDAAQLNATATVPGTFVYTPAAGTVLAAGTHVLSAQFQPSDGTNFQHASASVAITVRKAAPVVTASGGTFTYDGSAHPATGSVTGAGGVPLAPLTFTYNGSSEAPVNAGTYEVVANYAGDANHEPAAATATIAISKAAAVLTWLAPVDISYGTALGAAQLNAAANMPGTFTYSPAAGTQLGAGTHTLSVEFAPDDAANYQSSSASVAIAVVKAMPVVTATGGTFTYDGNAHPATGSVTGPGGVTLGPLTFTYNGSSDAPVNAGAYEVVATYAGDANHESASATTTVTIGKAAAAVTWPPPATIVYGTALGPAQLNATANVPGTFTYTPAAGTVLDAGAGRTLSVTFTPADAANYTAASASTSIDVSRAPLTVRAEDAVKRFGAPLPVFSATVTGLVNGDTTAALTGTLAFATMATPQSAVGAYPIVPSGVSAANYTVTFANGTLSIVRGAVDVAVTSAPEPSGADQVMTFTAIVAAQAPAAGTPGGVIRFFDGTTLLGTAPVVSNSATLSTAGLVPGTHTIEARYDGNGSFEPGASASSHVIADANHTPALTVTSSRNPSNAGQSVTLTANVSMAAGAVSGMVEFYSGGTLLSTAPVSAGRALFTTSSLTAGAHAITARYVGGGGVPPALSQVFVQTVGVTGWKNRAATVTVTATPNPAALGQAVLITVDVIGSSTTAPTGRVLILVNGTVAADVPVAAIDATTARATASLTNLAHGSHTVSATYLADATYRGSTARTSVVVN